MKKTLIALAALSLVISTVLLAEQVEKKDLTGVWEAKISPTGVPPPPMLAMAMFGKDGSFVGTLNRRFQLFLSYRPLRPTWAPHMADGSNRAIESSG